MGRNLMTATQPQRIWEREAYSARPLWEYVTQNSSATSPWRAVYGPTDTVNYLEYTPLGSQNNSRSRSWGRNNDEATSHYPLVGNTTSGSTSSSWSPSSGYWGITGFTNTGTCNNWYSSVTEFGYIDGTDAANVLRYSTPVILPAIELQNFELITLNTTVGVYPIGATWAAHVNNTAFPRVDVTQLTGFQAATGQVATNFGMACYNARIGVYALLLRTGTSGANYRLHLFPIGPGIRAHTTYAELLAAFQASMSGYRFVDITLNGLSHTGTENDRYAHRLCLCDDGTLWIVVTDTSNTTSGAQGLRVFRVTDSVMSATGTLTLSQHVQSATSGAHYGLNAGTQYATRFMLSDDQSVMAVYTHHHYYLSGAVGRFLPTDSVNNTALGCRGFLYNDSSYGFSIAPVGGSAFAICRGHDKNGAQAHLWFLDPRFSTLAETGSDTTMRTVVGAYPQREDSTMYQGQFVNKILPLDRFK